MGVEVGGGVFFYKNRRGWEWEQEKAGEWD